MAFDARVRLREGLLGRAQVPGSSIYSVPDGPKVEMRNGKPVYYRFGDPVHKN